MIGIPMTKPEPKLVEYVYEVNVGNGAANGSVWLPDDASDDEIQLAIMDQLYSVTYHKKEN